MCGRCAVSLHGAHIRAVGSHGAGACRLPLSIGRHKTNRVPLLLPMHPGTQRQAVRAQQHGATSQATNLLLAVMAEALGDLPRKVLFAALAAPLCKRQAPAKRDGRLVRPVERHHVLKRPQHDSEVGRVAVGEVGHAGDDREVEAEYHVALVTRRVTLACGRHPASNVRSTAYLVFHEPLMHP